MTTRIADISQRQAARVAGIGYLIIFVVALFVNFVVLDSLIVSGDAATTANNIMASESLFRIGIAGFLVVIGADVVVALALFVFLKQVNKSLSLLAGWFRLMYGAIFTVAVASLIIALQLLGGNDYMTVFEKDQLSALALLFLNAFSYTWLVALAFFGLHLLVVGYLAIKSGYIPKILGVLLIIAGLGYVIDSFANILIPNYEANIAMFTVLGELLFPFWLLIRGVKVQQQDNPAPASP